MTQNTTTGRLPGLDDLPADLSGQTVFVRVDFNVPMDGAVIIDDARVRQALPTLGALQKRGARLVVASHRGRPKGERSAELSLAPVATRLAELMAQATASEGPGVLFCSDCIGDARSEALRNLAPGAVLLLENLRFHTGEEANDPRFAADLARGCDIYVNDAFGSAHRAHASVSAITRLFDSGRTAAGQLMQREVEELSALLVKPERPFVAVLGGAKISGKIDTLSHLVETVDALVIGGAMANTFLLADGAGVGRSLVEETRTGDALHIRSRAEERGIDLLLPVDLVVTDQLGEPANTARLAETVDASVVPADRLAVDIGPATRRSFRAAIDGARSVFWNGPMGVFEVPEFSHGTRAIAEAVGATAGYTIVGGGETAAAARAAGVEEAIDWVSTGGGASLELLAGQDLPGVEALRPGNESADESPGDAS